MVSLESSDTSLSASSSSAAQSQSLSGQNVNGGAATTDASHKPNITLTAFWCHGENLFIQVEKVFAPTRRQKKRRMLARQGSLEQMGVSANQVGASRSAAANDGAGRSNSGSGSRVRQSSRTTSGGDGYSSDEGSLGGDYDTIGTIPGWIRDEFRDAQRDEQMASGNGAATTDGPAAATGEDGDDDYIDGNDDLEQDDGAGVAPMDMHRTKSAGNIDAPSTSAGGVGPHGIRTRGRGKVASGLYHHPVAGKPFQYVSPYARNVPSSSGRKSAGGRLPRNGSAGPLVPAGPPRSAKSTVRPLTEVERLREERRRANVELKRLEQDKRALELRIQQEEEHRLAIEKEKSLQQDIEMLKNMLVMQEQQMRERDKVIMSLQEKVMSQENNREESCSPKSPAPSSNGKGSNGSSKNVRSNSAAPRPKENSKICSLQ